MDSCFQDSEGVDSKLADKVWFINHLKWIAWKLIAYDLRFQSFFNGERYSLLLKASTLTILTFNYRIKRTFHPINILSQIKYRYDVEIGNARRFIFIIKVIKVYFLEK